MARPKTTTDDVVTPSRVKVLERRLTNPLGEPSAPIELKDPSLVCRWVNGAIAADKVWRAKNKGWEPVRPDEVLDLDQVGGYNKSPEGFITRGDRGQEVLMSMPRDWRDKIALAKTRENLKNMGDPNATKSEIAHAAAERFGGQAGDFIDRRVNIVGGVRDQHERIERTGDALE